MKKRKYTRYNHAINGSVIPVHVSTTTYPQMQVDVQITKEGMVTNIRFPMEIERGVTR